MLPAHALSEISRDNQYSLSSVIAAVGVPDASAALVGTLLRGDGRARHRRRSPAGAPVWRPGVDAARSAGLHAARRNVRATEDIAAAVPACLVLYTQAQAYRGWIFAALVLLAVPWMMATSVAMFLAPLFPVAYLTYVLWKREQKVALGVAMLSFLAILGLFAVASATPPHPTATPHAFPPIDPRLAEASWRAFVLGNSTNRPAMWLLRLPTWIGLIAFAASAVVLGRKATGTLVAKEYRLTESRA